MAGRSMTWWVLWGLVSGHSICPQEQAWGLALVTSVAPPAPGNAQGALPARAGGRLLMWRIGGGGTIGMAGALLQANIERGDPHGLLLDDGEQLDDQAAHDEQGLSPTGGIERKTH